MAGGVEASLVPDEHHVLPGCDLAAHFMKKDVDDGRVNMRRDHAHSLAGFGADRAKHIEPVILGLLDRRWTRAGRCPLTAHRPLLAEPCLILEPDFDAFTRMGLGDLSHFAAGFFLNCIWAAGSLLAWRGRGIKQL